MQDVDENTRMVRSLAPMWAEELARVTSASGRTEAADAVDEWARLRPPSSPPRNPQLLPDCAGVREQLRAIFNSIQQSCEDEPRDNLNSQTPAGAAGSQAGSEDLLHALASQQNGVSQPHLLLEPFWPVPYNAAQCLADCMHPLMLSYCLRTRGWKLLASLRRTRPSLRPLWIRSSSASVSVSVSNTSKKM